MNKADFKRCFEAAQIPQNSTNQDHLAVTFGCGLPDFPRKSVTVACMATLIRYQAMQMNGEWDVQELNDLAFIAKKKFELID